MKKELSHTTFLLFYLFISYASMTHQKVSVIELLLFVVTT